MKIKTDSTHKGFKPTKINQNVKKIFKKFGLALVISGTVLACSGCSKISKEARKENERIVSLYEEGTLATQPIEDISLFYAPVGNEMISELPRDLKDLDLYYENYITNLSALPTTCPYLESISLNWCNGITNYEFIEQLPNLKSFKIEGETIGITEELITYLDNHGIKHNLDSRLVQYDQEIERIANSIVNEEMSDREKMDAIASYVTHNMKYDYSALLSTSKIEEYDNKLLGAALDGKGVCANYAALTNALCVKSGVNSYYVINEVHGWNLVELDGKYYYVDTTNIDQIPVISGFMMEKFGVGFGYMQDPYATGLSAMSDIDKVNAPDALLQLIEESKDKKSFIEKYGSNAFFNLSVLIGLTIGFSMSGNVLRYILK